MERIENNLEDIIWVYFKHENLVLGVVYNHPVSSRYAQENLIVKL